MRFSNKFPFTHVGPKFVGVGVLIRESIRK